MIIYSSACNNIHNIFIYLDEVETAEVDQGVYELQFVGPQALCTVHPPSELPLLHTGTQQADDRWPVVHFSPSIYPVALF